MPELIYDAADAVPAPLKDIAVEKDGKWVANVVPKKELDDFRENNLKISRDRDNLTSVIGRLTTDVGFDTEKIDEFVTSYKELQDTHQQVADGKLVKDTSLAAAVDAKTGEMKRNYEAQINGLSTENKTIKADNEKLKLDVNRSVIDREFMMAINDPKSGALPEASRHILREVYDTYAVDENKQLIPKDKDGNVIYGSDGATPMKPAEFLQKLQETNPFFFKQAQGGGGGGGQGQGGGLSPAEIAAMSPEERMTYGREHGMNK